MAVGESFRDALDIRQTDRVCGGKKTLTWTQGGSFSFSPGDTLYDTPKAYEQWGSALRQIRTAYQVVDATPSRPERRQIFFKRKSEFHGSLKGHRPRANVARREKILSVIPLSWTEAETIAEHIAGETGSRVSGDLMQELCDLGALEKKTETLSPRFAGHIRFRVLEPTPDRNALHAIGEKTMSQDAFVKLLITGASSNHRSEKDG